MRAKRAISILASVLCGATSFEGLAADGSETAGGVDFFENRIRPLLVERCYPCHSAAKKRPKGGLRLDSRAGWAKGGDRGPALVPGNPRASLIIEAVRYDDPDLRMPPKRKLPAARIADLERWVRMGAPDPRGATVPLDSKDAEPARDEPRGSPGSDPRSWAWRPVAPSAAPPVESTDRVRSDIDRFVLSKLEARGIVPNGEADRRTLIRRVTFDLTGLPPTRAEVDAFLGDASPTAFESVVDRLLESPHYGEHWGQHWLDLVRFAETRGHESDYAIPEAWRFRDYVIKGFNADVPYDRWMIEHIAGDLVENPRLDPRDRTNQSIQGTGFWHLGEATHSPVDIRGDEASRVHNQIDVFSRTFLGLSLGCARCHEHKFDPISQADYYAMFGYLQSSGFQLADVSDPVGQKKVVDDLARLDESRLPAIIADFAAEKRAQLARLPAYLIAAHAGAGGTGTEGLDTKTLQRVRAHLAAAATDANDPLHAFSVVAAGKASLDEIRERKETVLEAWRRRQAETSTELASTVVTRSVKDGERNYTPQRHSFSDADVIVDYSRCRDEDWIPSGHRFGAAPRLAGGILIGTAEQPITAVIHEGFADSSLPSRRLSGFLRTPTFEVEADHIWYRVRGSGTIFLAVDSHRVVEGPLHGGVKKTIKGDPRKWAWHSQQVRDYMGHRIHAEFSPGEGFAIDKVLWSDRPPPEVFEPNEQLRSWLRDAEGSSPRKLAELFAERLQTSVDRLAGRDLARRDGPKDHARLLSWLVRHEGLLERKPDLREKLADRVRAYREEKSRIENRIPGAIHALALLDGSSEDEPIHIRGNHKNRSRHLVPRAELAAFHANGNLPARPKRGSGRLELARRLASPDNPLVSRVIVNRIWHHLLGRGIVQSVDDFGVMGIAPTHPDLLDHLARRLVANGWSLKRTIREVVLTSTYRMSSRPNASGAEIDPENKLFHRMRVRRLPAESIRDRVLAVSGRLDRRTYGKSIMVHITPFMRGNRSPAGSGPLDGDGRRSIYTEVRRNHLAAMLLAFDKPIPFMTIGRRSVSNAPAQPLILLNDALVHQQAGIWGKRLLAENKGRDDRGIIEIAYHDAFNRPPRVFETEAALGFLDTQAQQYDAGNPSSARERVWIDLCHTLINVKEFIFLD